MQRGACTSNAGSSRPSPGAAPVCQGGNSCRSSKVLLCRPGQVFKRECWNGFEDDGGRWRICYSDEHYFSTVLATKGLDQVMSLRCCALQARPPHHARAAVACPLLILVMPATGLSGGGWGEAR